MLLCFRWLYLISWATCIAWQPCLYTVSLVLNDVKSAPGKFKFNCCSQYNIFILSSAVCVRCISRQRCCGIRCSSGNQWSLRWDGVTWSRGPTPTTRCTAVFWSRCKDSFTLREICHGILLKFVYFLFLFNLINIICSLLLYVLCIINFVVSVAGPTVADHIALCCLCDLLSSPCLYACCLLIHCSTHCLHCLLNFIMYLLSLCDTLYCVYIVYVCFVTVQHILMCICCCLIFHVHILQHFVVFNISLPLFSTSQALFYLSSTFYFNMWICGYCCVHSSTF